MRYSYDRCPGENSLSFLLLFCPNLSVLQVVEGTRRDDPACIGAFRGVTRADPEGDFGIEINQTDDSEIFIDRLQGFMHNYAKTSPRSSLQWKEYFAV